MLGRLSSLLTVALTAALAPAQIVNVSEINFTPRGSADDQWIELVNFGPGRADISNWSLYLATNTHARLNAYWFGFRPGTTIEPASFLRVHWNVPARPSTPTDVYTGDTPFHFLFGLGAESIPRNAGAIALFNTQLNSQMNSPAAMQDWVSWGSGGLARESVAVAAGKWFAGQFVAPPAAADSIALSIFENQEPTPVSSFFHDDSPTPGANNAPGAAKFSYGTNCAIGTVNPLVLSVNSVACGGNRDFGFVIDGTQTFDSLLLIVSAGRGDGSLQVGPCTIWLDENGPLSVLSLPGSLGRTRIPLPLPTSGLGVGTLYFQAVALRPPSLGDFGLSQGIELSLGL